MELEGNGDRKTGKGLSICHISSWPEMTLLAMTYRQSAGHAHHAVRPQYAGLCLRAGWPCAEDKFSQCSHELQVGGTCWFSNEDRNLCEGREGSSSMDRGMVQPQVAKER